MTRFLWKDRVHDYIAIYEGRRGRSARLRARAGVIAVGATRR